MGQAEGGNYLGEGGSLGNRHLSKHAFYAEGETIWSVSIGNHDIYKG